MSALGEALLHFLWQGALLALLCWMGLLILERPAARYALAAVTMALMALAVPLTMLFIDGAPAGFASGAPDWPWMPVAWACGALLLGVRAICGWLLELRRARRARPSPEWQRRVEALAARMGVRQAVRVLETARAECPQVFGWLRPVLLLPVGALCGLAPEQLEAVLAHELAHIRRRDYLVNLLQVVVECLLYYHPAVWWVSRRMRVERELCCDEVAIEFCGDRVFYSRALLRLEESRAEFSMAAGTSLKERIGRILGMRERTNALIPALTLVLAALLCGGWLWAAAQDPPAPPPPAPPPEPPAEVAKPPKPPAPPKPPQPPAPMKVDKAELERRTRYADKRFAEPGKAGSTTDRGKAYLKWGPPDQIESHSDKGEQWRYNDGRELRFNALLRLMPSPGHEPDSVEHAMADVARAADLRVEWDSYRLIFHYHGGSKSFAVIPGVATPEERARRARYAEERFSEPGKPGAQTDRGRAYLMFGPPDEIESHPGKKEEWLYRNERLFEFNATNQLVGMRPIGPSAKPQP
jgi:Zn-dependent protease with chaperone function